jgi:hypothetical protein
MIFLEPKEPFPVEPNQQKSSFPLSDSETSQGEDSFRKFSETPLRRGPTHYRRLKKVLSSSSSSPASPLKPWLESPPAPLAPKDSLARRRPLMKSSSAKWAPASPHSVSTARTLFSGKEGQLPPIEKAKPRFTSLSE